MEQETTIETLDEFPAAVRELKGGVFREESNEKWELDFKINSEKPANGENTGDKFQPEYWQWQARRLRNEKIIKQDSIFGKPVIPSKDIKKTIIISSKGKVKLRRQLKDIMGLSEESLFPDFYGFAYAHGLAFSYQTKTSEDFFAQENIGFMKGAYRDAINNYDEVIKLNPEYANAYLNCGVTHQELGNPKQAGEDFAKTQELVKNKTFPANKINPKHDRQLALSRRFY